MKRQPSSFTHLLEAARLYGVTGVELGRRRDRLEFPNEPGIIAP